MPEALSEFSGRKISLPKDSLDVQEQELLSSTTGSVSGSVNDGLAFQSTEQLLAISARTDKSLTRRGYQTTCADIMRRVVTGQPAPAEPA